MTYKPRAETAALLDAAWNFVQSVSYQVSARWLFYRLLQESWVSSKDDYKKVISVLSSARKRFYRGWRPDTIADDTRSVEQAGVGYRSVDEWLSAVPEQVFSYVDRWEEQDNFVIVCFEAAAMAGQFDFYLPPFVPRVAFKGDVSIPAKWKIARLLTAAHLRYQVPVKLVYFGDLDPKGLIIPESAVTDIGAWLGPGVDFEYIRAGLNPGDENTYDLPENPDRPGTFQWEALDDNAAEGLITGAIASYVDASQEDVCQAEDDRRTDAFKEWWDEHGPSADDLGLD